jgi:alpha-glucosidase (family GH31 glycosyl hydrolase)
MRLLDYIYEEAKILSHAALPLMRYPALEFPEAHDFLSQDSYSYLFARDLLVCPVLEKGARARDVYLPPGGWVDLCSGSHFEGSRVVIATRRSSVFPCSSVRIVRAFRSCSGLPRSSNV